MDNEKAEELSKKFIEANPYAQYAVSMGRSDRSGVTFASLAIAYELWKMRTEEFGLEYDL